MKEEAMSLLFSLSLCEDGTNYLVMIDLINSDGDIIAIELFG